MFNYQPIIRIQDKSIVGVEVLSRWRDYHRTDVSPELFIPLIKKIGLYRQYYINIIEKSLSEIAPLAIKHQLMISLNVGRTDPKFFQLQTKPFKNICTGYRFF